VNDLLAILGAPEEFRGSEVVLTGYLCSDHFEDVSLWLSEACYRERHFGHSLALGYDSEDMLEALAHSHGRRITVTGVVDPEHRGHFGMWPAGIGCSSFVVSDDLVAGACSTAVHKDYRPDPADGMWLGERPSNARPE
jgi:hypothetical protein